MLNKHTLISADKALPGRAETLPLAEQHVVLGTPLAETEPGAFAEQGLEQAIFGLGCFWGAEKRFWSLPGVYSTAAGYAGGYTPNPTYQEVCSGKTAHAEVVLVIFDPAKVSYEVLLQDFWEAHNPTQGMRQGNDQGTQYRSIILYSNEQQKNAAESSLEHYQALLEQKGFQAITTEIQQAGEFFYAEDFHQQYLAKNPQGYCGLGGTGVCYA